MRSCTILWSTQSGRAKACARRTKRVLTERTTLQISDVGSSFDDLETLFIEWVCHDVSEETLLLLFVSTTGDGEHCDSIRNTWRTLLQKSLGKDLFAKRKFALFCLGDRAYGPQFCAAGRKLAVRLLQLGMTRYCDVGYGDDNTPNGGVFRDLDDWIDDSLVPLLEPRIQDSQMPLATMPSNPFKVLLGQESNGNVGGAYEWEDPVFAQDYDDYFQQFCPVTAYSYDENTQRIQPGDTKFSSPLLGEVLSNTRLTASNWEQDTRHITIQTRSGSVKVSSQAPERLPYQAGDVAAILPFNSNKEVERFLKVLPEHLQRVCDRPLNINMVNSLMKGFVRWPTKCTLRGWLKYCADIQSLPEREDLRALSFYCSDKEDTGKQQSEKLRSLSETSESALYADYILKEKRSWADVLFDFESLREDGSKLSLESLLVLLPAMRPREFSIASAPSRPINRSESSFCIDLCVAVVKGTTRRGRQYHGLCSEYLSQLVPDRLESPNLLKCWIRPGSFGKLPLDLRDDGSFATPVICVGAGTGVAPMRSIFQERATVQESRLSSERHVSNDENQNILVFGCRKKECDFYYKNEWSSMTASKNFRLLTAFSRDQFQKIYVQRVLREADGGMLIAHHLLDCGGALYVAGGPRMARAVKDEVIEALGDSLAGGKKEAIQFLNNLQRKGLYSVEAWS